MCPSGGTFVAQTASGKSEFRTAFDVMDADHDGKISSEDLRRFYAGFSDGADEDDVIGWMMLMADFNKDGFVEYEEFERVLGANKRSSNGLMEDVFKIMDKDGDGILSHDDLKSFMGWAGLDASDDDIKAMITLGCGDKKDGLSYDDLLKILAVD